MPDLPIKLPPNPPEKPSGIRPSLQFAATFVGVFLAALLVLQWL